MIPALAAAEMLKTFAIPDSFQKDSKGTATAHLKYMLHELATGVVEGEKAHRWLGYAQGILVYTGYLTLDECKEINKEAV